MDCSLGEGKEAEGMSVLYACMLMWMQAPVHMYVCATNIHIQLCAHQHENAYVLVHMFMSGA